MTDEASNPEKKIIIDEDWKSQVEKEREAVLHPKEEQPEQLGGDAQDLHIPPPSLSYLAGTLYLQAAISLGLMPHPVTGKRDVQLAHAKHAIDTLEILQEKTEGNRTPDESQEMEGMLHQLRMAYIEVSR